MIQHNHPASCSMGGCDRPAIMRPVWDANPDPDARQQIGTVAICDECQARIDHINGMVGPEDTGRTIEDLEAEEAYYAAEAARGELAGSPHTMPCYACGGYDGVTAPEREVVALGLITNRADPTQTYRLACGHTVI